MQSAATLPAPPCIKECPPNWLEINEIVLPTWLPNAHACTVAPRNLVPSSGIVLFKRTCRVLFHRVYLMNVGKRWELQRQSARTKSSC